MQWNFERSKERISKESERIQKAGMTISRLSKEMDLSNLSPTDARIVHGSHIYTHVANFGEILDSPLLRRDDFKRLHRLLHILRVEQRYTLQRIFDGDKIQVQGPKFHGLLYKPYGDDATLAWKSVLAALALNLIARNALPLVFPDYPNLLSISGIELGDCLVANIGARGERELISVGAAANYAAKLLEANDSITVGAMLWEKLQKEHQELFIPVGNAYVLDETKISDSEGLLKEESYSWTVKQSADRMQATCDSLPLSEIDSSEAQSEIDFSLLGPKTMKTCSGSSIFVDVDKYTATIDSLLEEEEELAKALQWLHLFRYEVRHVTTDRSAVVVQHQGDRLQALTHLPYDNDKLARRKAVELCIDYASSVEEVLNVYHATLGQLHVSIGASFGKTVAIRSGVRGDMDSGCLAKIITEAEHWQIQGAAGEISISAKMCDAIDDEVIRESFHFDEDRSCYIAKGLTWTKIGDLRKSRQYASREPASFNKTTSGIVFGVSAQQSRDNIPLKQTRNWGSDE
jgi:class 3 adenylate cyclase